MTFDEDDDDFDDADQERGGVIWGQWGGFFCKRVQSESEGIVVTAVSILPLEREKCESFLLEIFSRLRLLSMTTPTNGLTFLGVYEVRKGPPL